MAGERRRVYGPRTVQLEPSRQKPPRLAADRDFHPETRRCWKRWWSHPAANEFHREEDAIWQLLELTERFQRADNDRVLALLAAQIRLARDGLGLSAKGQRDRGWTLPTELQVAPKAPKSKPSAALELAPSSNADADPFNQPFDSEGEA